MARIRTVEKDERPPVKRGNDFNYRAPFREAIVNLQPGRQIEIVPDDGETLRGLRHNLARAIREIKLQVTYHQVTYGSTEEGTIIVW